MRTSQAWPQLQVGLKLCAKAGFDIHKAPAVLPTYPELDSRKVALRAEIASMQARGWAPGRTDDGLWDAVTTTRGDFAV